jgi:hypothetical protein
MAFALVLPASGLAAGRTLFVVVRANGSLVHGSTGVAVTHSPAVPGVYRVQFPVNVTRCAYLAAPVMFGVLEPVASISTSVVRGAPKQLQVVAVDRVFAPIDVSFTVQVLCKQPDLWAVVDETGAVARSGVPVTATHLATGRYTVTFDRKVSSCGYGAAVADPGSVRWVPPLIEVAPALDQPRSVNVVERNANGIYVDTPFHVAVSCGSKRIWAVLPSPPSSGSVHGSHVVTAAAQGLPGFVLVRFDLPIDSCSALATVGGWDYHLPAQAYVVSYAFALLQTDVVAGTLDVNGNGIDRGMHLNVVC